MTSGTTTSASPSTVTASASSGSGRAATPRPREDSVWRWSLEADAIALSGIREARAAGHDAGRAEDLQRIKGTTTRVPVRDDSLLADVFQEWAIRRVEAEMPGYFANARVVVVGGTTRERTIAVLREFTDNIIFDEAGSRHRAARPGQDQSGDGDRRRDRRVRLAARPGLHQGSGRRAGRHWSATRSPTSPPRTPTSSSARSPS